MQLSEIQQIHRKKKAIYNKLYLEDSGIVYIGTLDNRLKELSRDFQVVSYSKNSKISTLKDFINVNFLELGENNIIHNTSKKILIQGNYNMVESETENIKIQGDSNIIRAGVKNVTLINTSGVTVTESDVTYINGKIKDYWVVETSGFVVDDTVYGYKLDGSSSTVQMRLNDSTSEFFVKCTNATNRVYVDAGTKTIDNTSSTFDLNENESIRVRWDEVDQTYYIIN